jgi:hypothetical protein
VNAVENIEKRVGEDVHPPCEDDKVGSGVDHATGDLGVIVLPTRAPVAFEEGLECADGGGDGGLVV